MSNFTGTLLLSTALLAACQGEPEAPSELAESVRSGLSSPLNATQSGYLEFTKAHVLPRMARYYGSNEEAAKQAAVVAWWSLKEGVWDLSNALAYSNCHFSSGDAHVGPFEVCPSNTWQLGIAGKQYHPDTQWLTDIGENAYGAPISQALSELAGQAGVDANAVIGSSGRLRNAWLLRLPAVGFITQAPAVAWECVENDYGWCYGSWGSAQRFASSRGHADQVREELRQHFLNHLIANSHEPRGVLEAAWGGLAAFGMYGWVYDPDDLNAALDVHVYVDNQFSTSLRADKSRPDIGQAYGIGPNHGFEAILPLSAGVHSVCVWAINVGAGTKHPQFGCKQVVVTDNAPVGYLDYAVSTPGGIAMGGWAVDTDAPSSPIGIHFYRDAGGAWEFLAAGQTGGERPDVLSAFPQFPGTTRPGYSAVIPPLHGAQRLCAFAINYPLGQSNPLLGCLDVVLP